VQTSKSEVTDSKQLCSQLHLILRYASSCELSAVASGVSRVDSGAMSVWRSTLKVLIRP
jgi:hypothetical protein